jgi:hypothetical protein
VFRVLVDLLDAAHPLDAAVGVGDGAAPFCPRRRREDDVRELGGLRHEDVLYDHEIQRLQPFFDLVAVGFAHHGVLAHHVQPLHRIPRLV